MEPSVLQNIQVGDVLLVVVGCIVAALIAAITLLIVAAQQVAKIDVPEDADFFETLQIIPITVPIALDLLDLAFDVFSAPISWIILELLGLKALQMVTIFESLIPGTQLIPTLTIAWVVARLMKKKRPTPLRTALHDYQLQSGGQYGRLGSGIGRGGGSLADRYRRKALPMPGEAFEDDVVEGDYDDIDGAPPEYLDEEEEDY